MQEVHSCVYYVEPIHIGFVHREYFVVKILMDSVKLELLI